MWPEGVYIVANTSFVHSRNTRWLLTLNTGAGLSWVSLYYGIFHLVVDTGVINVVQLLILKRSLTAGEGQTINLSDPVGQIILYFMTRMIRSAKDWKPSIQPAVKVSKCKFYHSHYLFPVTYFTLYHSLVCSNQK